MSIKDLINKSYEKDSSGFESLFSDIMSEKMEAAIGAKYADMFEAKESDDEEDESDDDADDEEDESDDDEDDEDEC